MLRLLSASQTGDLLFSLESVVYKEPQNGNTLCNTHTHFNMHSVTYTVTHTFILQGFTTGFVSLISSNI